MTIEVEVEALRKPQASIGSPGVASAVEARCPTESAA